MSQATTMTVSDGSSNRTYGFAAGMPGNLVYKDRSSGVAIGFSTIKVGYREASKTSKVFRTEITMSDPVLENVVGADQNGLSPAPALAYEGKVIITFLSHERSTAAQRTALLEKAKSVLALQEVQAQIVNLDPIFV